jgi:alkanesulfonate monooxygenase SsuD/methylene tetrahydromethanopterin reductase-like flavin-dependent oxidoreductase (luciferase family)
VRAQPWFGLFLPQMRMSFETVLERTLAAEAAGFDSVWLMDHFAPPAAADHDSFEGWTLAAALLARTTTIRIGHLTTCDALRPPALLAKMAATLDVMSGGRLDLGLGWGSVPDELRVFGVGERPPAERAARMRETLDILGLMFAGERFDYDGDYYRLEGAIGRPVPVQDKLPVHIGGAGVKLTFPLVRDYADWWNCPCYGVDRYDELRPLAGDDVRVSVQRPIGLAPDRASRDAVVDTAERRFGSWGGLVAGTADEIAPVLAADVARGIDGFVLQFTDFGPPETIERFMAEVAAPILGSDSA